MARNMPKWRTGDKVAAYGLTGLITGGVVVGAAKSGLLAKLVALLAAGAKAIYVAIAAFLAWIGRLFSRKGKAGSR